MITIKVIEAKSLWAKAKGLLETTQPYSLLLKTRWGIHTFGMKYPIDVVILDDLHRIVKLKHNLRPNRIFLWNPKYETVVELPAGFVEKNNLKIGKRISLQSF